MNTTASLVSPAALLSSHELSKATDYLLSTRHNLVEAVGGLSDSQWVFKPADDCWSIAEIVEHVAVIENRVHAVVGRMQEAPLCEPDRVNSPIDERILAEVVRRTIKIKAPEAVWPSHRWSPRESLARFVASRSRTMELLVETPCLRGRVLPHPVLGSCDGYQWILAVAAHNARHTEQILEVKRCRGFAETGAAQSS